MPDCGRVLRRIKECRNQIVATAIVSLGSLGTGTVFGWSSVAVVSINATERYYNGNNGITKDMISWVTSLAIFGALIGGLVSGLLMDYVGRKLAILILTLPFFVGWTIMFSTRFLQPHTFYLLYMGRLLTGFSAGGFLIVVPTYIKEIAFAEMRGILGSTMPLLLVTGLLFSFVVGAYTDWFVLTVCSAISPVLLALGTLFIPETPRYLVVKKKLNEAVQSFKWSCRIESDQLAREKMIDAFSPDGIITEDGEVEVVVKKRPFLSRPVLTPIFIMVFLMLFQQLAGVNAVTLYTVEIFQGAGHHLTSPETATVILGVVNVLAEIMSMFVVDLLGRKTLIVTLNFVMTICLGCLGAYFYLAENGSEVELRWLPAVTIYTYMFAYCCGVGSVAWVLGPEIYNPDYTAESASVMVTSYWIFGFIVAKTYEDLKNILTIAGSFWFYAGFCLGGAIFAIIFVPETKGRSFEEISKYFGAVPHERKSSVEDKDSHPDEILVLVDQALASDSDNSVQHLEINAMEEAVANQKDQKLNQNNAMEEAAVTANQKEHKPNQNKALEQAALATNRKDQTKPKP